MQPVPRHHLQPEVDQSKRDFITPKPAAGLAQPQDRIGNQIVDDTVSNATWYHHVGQIQSYAVQ